MKMHDVPGTISTLKQIATESPLYSACTGAHDLRWLLIRRYFTRREERYLCTLPRETLERLSELYSNKSARQVCDAFKREVPVI